MIMSGYWNEYGTGTYMRDKLITFVTHIQHCEYFITDLYYTVQAYISRSSIKILRDEDNPFSLFLFFSMFPKFGKSFPIIIFWNSEVHFFLFECKKISIKWLILAKKRAFRHDKNFDVYILNECRYCQNTILKDIISF